jgi:hypothetical protein
MHMSTTNTLFSDLTETECQSISGGDGVSFLSPPTVSGNTVTYNQIGGSTDYSSYGYLQGSTLTIKNADTNPQVSINGGYLLLSNQGFKFGTYYLP